MLVDSDTGFVILPGVASADVQKNADANTMKVRLDYAVMKLLKVSKIVTAVPLTKKKLSKQADVAGIDKGSSNPRHELGPVA